MRSRRLVGKSKPVAKNKVFDVCDNGKVLRRAAMKARHAAFYNFKIYSNFKIYPAKIHSAAAAASLFDGCRCNLFRGFGKDHRAVEKSVRHHLYQSFSGGLTVEKFGLTFGAGKEAGGLIAARFYVVHPK